MKMISISLEVPKDTDEFYRTEAKRRFVSKSAVIREVLIRHVREVEREEQADRELCSK